MVVENRIYCHSLALVTVIPIVNCNVLTQQTHIIRHIGLLPNIEPSHADGLVCKLWWNGETSVVGDVRVSANQHTHHFFHNDKGLTGAK